MLKTSKPQEAAQSVREGEGRGGEGRGGEGRGREGTGREGRGREGRGGEGVNKVLQPAQSVSLKASITL